jgi:predicted lactoylglutathione lyase
MAGVIDHAGIVVADLATSRAFYRAALEPLGFRILYENEENVGLGTEGNDDFGIWQRPQPMAEETTGVHLAFVAADNEAVDAFFAAAMSHGGREHHSPAYHPEFHPGYYAAFVWDMDGNHVEAVHHNR